MKKLVPFAVLCTLLQGCVGFLTLKSNTKEINAPVVYADRGIANPIRTRNSEDKNSIMETTECTTNWLQTHWGSPNSVSHVSVGSDEIWTYRIRAIWEGVVPCVVIPIPLALPVGSEKVRFTLRDGRVVNASITKPWMVGGVAGYFISPVGGGGFGAMSFDQETPN